MRRIEHLIGITLISLLMAYIFWSQASDDNRFKMMALFAVVILFLFSGYWRLYQFYKLEKIRQLHNRKDFIDYFDNMNFISNGWQHFILPLPILRKQSSRKENEIRTTVNITTFLIYLLFGVFIYLSIDLKL